jgi:glycosyltransferase involved in cell wall biosynthesis
VLDEHDAVLDFDNPDMARLAGEVLDAVMPDVVHLHSVQKLSAGVARACLERGIPYVVTLHDAWWVCARQFMVRDNGTYCFQTRIDTRVCERCLPWMKHLPQRLEMLLGTLSGAALLISPSEPHRQLYVANGIDPARIIVQPNGIRLPAHRPPPRQGRLRFGYVGGVAPLKGFHLVRQAFETIERDDYDLVLVDNTLNLGFSSMDVTGWRIRGRIEIVPAYTQDDMDAFFSGLDVLLFPSQWKESFGLTVREALARDVWVIATEGGGPAEAIEDGVNGTLIPMDGRAEGLRRAILDLLEHQERLRPFRNPGARDIASYDTQAGHLHALLHDLARRETAGRSVNG